MTLLHCSAVFALVIYALRAQLMPQLPFAWHHDMDYDEMINASSLILVGRVSSLTFVGNIRHAQDDQGQSGDWRLTKVETKVEKVLKGATEHSSIHFYFYTTTGGTSGDWNALAIGSRYVFFLSEQNGVLRAVRDYWRSSIEVGSGRHDSLPWKDRLSVQQHIAILLLTPGANLKPKTFQFTLMRAVPLAREWLGPCRTVRLLRKLSTYPDQTVQGAARNQLDLQFKNENCP